MNGVSLQNNAVRMVVIGLLVVGAFFGAYRFASAKNGRASNPTRGEASVQGAATKNFGTGTAGGSAAAGCACCDGSSAPAVNGVSGDVVEGVAALSGGVQAIAVDVTSVYDPNVIKLKAGVPAEITFSQSSGCTAQVQSVDLGFSEDLSGGPKTVKLPALKAGTYAFSCGMNMVFGKIVVE